MLSVVGNSDAPAEAARVWNGWNKFRQLAPLLIHNDASLLTKAIQTLRAKLVCATDCSKWRQLDTGQQHKDRKWVSKRFSANSHPCYPGAVKWLLFLLFFCVAWTEQPVQCVSVCVYCGTTGPWTKFTRLVAWLEFNVPFQHKYGYIRNERSG